jgi:hypothetical protein
MPSRRAISCVEAQEKQPNNLARIAHRNPLRWHRSLPWDCQRGDLIRPTAAPANPRKTPGGIIPLWGAQSSRNRGAASFRYGGRHHPGIRGRLPQESAFVDADLSSLPDDLDALKAALTRAGIDPRLRVHTSNAWLIGEAAHREPREPQHLTCSKGLCVPQRPEATLAVARPALASRRPSSEFSCELESQHRHYDRIINLFSSWQSRHHE